jgi:hypothetical protein
VNESIKLRNSIVDKFERVRLDTFDENDIKALLIDIREYIRDQSLLRELADFIAHPKRDKGICHKLINVRYAKLSLVQEQQNKIEAEGGLRKKNIKTEWEYSSLMLSSISTDRIPSNLFKVLFLDGLEDVDEKYLFKYYKIGRNDMLEFIKNSYFLSEKDYVLKNLKYRDTLDDMLKFIRGFVSGKPAFDQATFNRELENSIRRISDTFNLDKEYLTVFKRKRKEVLLCIMCLIHDARLTFYNKHEGRIYLTTCNNSMALATDETMFRFYLFISDLKITDYLESNADFSSVGDMDEIKWINAKRNTDNKLRLTL